MYTKLSKKRTFGEDIMKPLSPFHGDTWWLILFVTIFVASETASHPDHLFVTPAAACFLSMQHGAIMF